MQDSIECIIHLVEECHPNLKSSSLPSYCLISKFLLYYYHSVFQLNEKGIVLLATWHALQQLLCNTTIMQFYYLLIDVLL